MLTIADQPPGSFLGIVRGGEVIRLTADSVYHRSVGPAFQPGLGATFAGLRTPAQASSHGYSAEVQVPAYDELCPNAAACSSEGVVFTLTLR